MTSFRAGDPPHAQTTGPSTPGHPTLPLVARSLTGLRASCLRHRVRVVLRWPDAQFQVCLDCVPPPGPATVPTGDLAKPDPAPGRTAARTARWRQVVALAARLVAVDVAVSGRPDEVAQHLTRHASRYTANRQVDIEIRASGTNGLSVTVFAGARTVGTGTLRPASAGPAT